jgi:hypothetical protein
MHPSNPTSRSATSRGVSQMSGYFISVGEALKLILPFKGDKQEVLAFIGNVDAALGVLNPE